MGASVRIGGLVLSIGLVLGVLLVAPASPPGPWNAGSPEPSTSAPRYLSPRPMLLSPTPTNVSLTAGYPVNQSLRYCGAADLGLAVPGGAIDPGTTRETSASLTAPPTIALNATRWCHSFVPPTFPSVTVPTLGNSSPQTVPWTDPHDQYGTPSGCHTIASVSVRSDAFFSGTTAVFASNGTVTRSTVIWRSVGSEPIAVSAPDRAQPGSSVFASVTDLTYTLSLWITLHGDDVNCTDGEVLASNWSLNLTEGQPSPSSASIPSINGTFLVAPRLAVDEVAVTPAFPSVGGTFDLRAEAGGGVPPLSYDWQQLPTGCAPANAPNITCVAGAAGAWHPGVWVTDSEGLQGQNSTWVNVAPTPPHSTAEPARATPLGSPAIVALFLGLLAAMILTVYWASRRRIPR